MPINTLATLPIAGKRILLRVDLNVPIKNGTLQDDYRLQAILPTITYLQKHGAESIILATHRGRPDLQSPDLALSTQHLIPWFRAKGYPLEFAATPEGALKKPLALLENLRFFEGEQTQSLELAQELASLADVYVNDAFGAMHRSDTSITLLASLFAPSNKGIGLCVQREIEHLKTLKNSPKQPYVVVLGGAKLSDKLPLITGLLQAPQAQRPTKIVIGGALCLPLLKAQGLGLEALHFDETVMQAAQTVLNVSRSQGVALILPTDFVYADNKPTDIGPESVQSFCAEISQAQTVFVNGTMGKYEEPAYAKGTQAVLEAIAKIKGYTVVGGGDAAAAAHQFGVADKFSFVSTGGGATLTYLAAKNPDSDLPGLKALGIHNNLLNF